MKRILAPIRRATFGFAGAALLLGCSAGWAQTTGAGGGGGASTGSIGAGGGGGGAARSGSSSGVGVGSLGNGGSSGFGPSMAIGSGSGAGVPGTGTGRGGVGTGSGYPTQANPFRTYFGNPLGMGMSTSSNASVPKTSFGQPLFGTVTTTNTGQTTGSVQDNSGMGFSTVGVRKAPPYVTTLADDFPLVKHTPGELERNLQDVLRRSTGLKGGAGLAVSVDGPVVVVRGRVGSQRERRLAESLLRLTPGVRELRNEIEVAE